MYVDKRQHNSVKVAVMFMYMTWRIYIELLNMGLRTAQLLCSSWYHLQILCTVLWMQEPWDWVLQCLH